MKGVKKANKGDEMKNIPEKKAEFVHVTKHQVIPQKMNGPMCALGGQQEVYEANYWKQQQKNLP